MRSGSIENLFALAIDGISSVKYVFDFYYAESLFTMLWIAYLIDVRPPDTTNQNEK